MELEIFLLQHAWGDREKGLNPLPIWLLPIRSRKQRKPATSRKGDTRRKSTSCRVHVSFLPTKSPSPQTSCSEQLSRLKSQVSFLKSLCTFNMKCIGGILKKNVEGIRLFSSGVSSSFSSPVRRASPAKVLQFDADPQKEIKTESLSSERPVPSSLLPLIGQVAETAEEKFRLLEQRDKILRQGEALCFDLLIWSHPWNTNRINIPGGVYRSIQADRPRLGFCWNVPRHVSRERTIHEGNPEPAKRLWGHPKHRDGNVFVYFPLFA